MAVSQGLRSEDFYKIVFAGIALFLFYQFMEKAISQVFVLNFSTAGPNITVVLVFLLATGFLYSLGLKKYWPHSPNFMLTLMISTVFASVLVLIPVKNIPILGAIIGLLALTPLIVHFISKLQEKFVLAAAFSIMFHITIRSLFDTAPIFSLTLSIVMFYLILTSWFVLWVWKREQINAATTDPIKLTGIAPLISFIFIEIMILGSPSVLARWYPRNYLLTVLVLGLGLVIGADVVLKEIIRKKDITDWKLAGYMLLYVVSLIVILWLDNEFAGVLAIFIVQTSAVIQLHKGTTIASEAYLISEFGKKMGLIQLLCIILILFQALSGNWAFLPGILEPILRGKAAWYLFILGMLLPISTALNYQWKDTSTKKVEVTS